MSAASLPLDRLFEAAADVRVRAHAPSAGFFVGAATNKETGEQIPWEKVKKALLDMVGNEDKANPLSDEELEEKLTAAGFPVKRRTVTKYRKLLNIASSRERKEHTPA